jgi:hypothetical protein
MTARDVNAAHLPNAIELVRGHLQRTAHGFRLVPNRPLWARSHVEGQMTPAEIWQSVEAFVESQTWSNKDEVLAKLRETLKIRVGREMVLLVRANELMTEFPYAGG